MKLKLFLATMFMGMLAAYSCKPVEDQPKQAESITLNHESIRMIVGEFATLTATVLPEDAEDKTVAWTSSDDKIATVRDGLVTAVAKGNADITATCNGISAKCEVTVNPKEAGSLTLDQTSATMTIGETMTLVATVLPEDAEDKTVTWESSDEKIATVKDGLVTAIAKGNADITATCNGISAKCEVTVNAKQASSVTLDKTTATLTVGETLTLVATVLPEDAEFKTVTWTSSNTTIATVTKEGLVTAIERGEVDITATCSGISAKCKITVNSKQVESVILDATELQLTVGESKTLVATVLPEDVYYLDKVVTWTSSNNDIATVNHLGLVTGNAEGEAEITAKAGEKEAICKVTVSNPIAAGAKVGDFYYSDGTYSSELDENKTVIGVVFYTGDPTLQDAALKKDHPECTHGLVVSLKIISSVQWQANFLPYYQANGTIGKWIEENTDYESSAIATAADVSDVNSNYNKIKGYNNTKGFEAFNAAPANADYTIGIAENVAAYRQSNPAPASSSDWYIPSIKEFAYLCTGALNIDEEKSIETLKGTANRAIVDASLAKVTGADQVGNNNYWSSTEIGMNVYQPKTGAGQYNATTSKSNRYTIARYILAF